jgi:PAS domain S-box-containing protein
LESLFSSEGFIPRRFCGNWPDWLVWEHVGGNALVWSAYIAVPLLIWQMEGRRTGWGPFRKITRAFALFISLCGLGHFIDMLAFFHPMYRLSGHLLVATGIASWWTTWTLFNSWAPLMAMKTPAEVARVIAELKGADADRAYLATIVESSDDAIVGKDLDGTITSWNSGAARLFGYSAAEAVGRSITFLMPADRQAEEVQILDRLRRGEKIEHFDSVRQTKDGRLIDVALTISPIKDRSGTIIGISKIARDITAKRLAEKALRASERAYRAIGESIPFGVWICDADGRHTYASDTFLELVGQTESQVPESSWATAIHPADAERTLAAWRECVRSESTWDAEHRIRGIDGKWHPVLARGVTVRDDDGQLIGWAGINLDISRLKEAEGHIRALNETLEKRVAERTAELAAANDALEEGGRRFRAIFDTMYQFIGLLAPDGTVLEANQTALDFAGLAREDVVGKPFWQARWWDMGPEVQDRLRQAIDQAAAGQFVRFEVENRGLGDRLETVDFSLKPMLDEAGKVVLVIPEGRVITEQKRAALALAESEAALRESQRLAGVGCWEWDPEIDRVSWSDELYRIAGRDPGLPAPRYCEHDVLYTAESLAREQVAVTTALAHGQPYEIELEMYCGDGTTRWTIGRGEAIRGADGRVTRLRGTVQDVNARKRFEDDLRRARDAAMAATRAKSDFLANMSHEIRTPMNGVIGMTELLMNTPLDRMQFAYAETIRTSAMALLTVINDILDFSKIEAGKLTVESVEFNLRMLIAGVADLLAPNVLQKGLDLNYHVANEIPNRLVGDPVRIRQVLTNLAGNAVKFTDRGRIDLDADLIAHDEEVATVRILVRDTGIGIPDSCQAEIFESFTQVEAGNSRRHGGTGLGLAICRRLVTLMGGKIGLETRPDAGSTFWFDLPLGHARTPREDLTVPAGGPTATPDGNALASRSSSSPLPLPPLRVLLAEDNDVNRRVAVAMAEQLGCRVDAVINGREALEALKSTTYNVILMDVQMPEMDGFMATAEIRAHERVTGQHVMIVALTAHAMVGDQARCIDAGMDAYISKPIRQQSLHDILASLFPCTPLPNPEPAESLEQQYGSFSTETIRNSCADEAELMAEIVTLMQGEVRSRLAQLDLAIANSDAFAVGREAHGLKGTLLTMGARPMIDACDDLINLGHDHDFRAMRAVYQTLPNEWARLDRETRQFVATLGLKPGN